MAETTTMQPQGFASTAEREGTRGGPFFTPRVDIFETDQELTVYADMPGVRNEDIDLRFERGELMLHGKVQPRHGQREFALQEYEVGDFYRVFSVHESIDASRIEAECKNGVLVIHLPKAEAVRPRQINVRGS